MDDEIILHYIGAERGAFVNGVPACDLTQADIDASGLSVERLLEYPGVYARTDAPLREPVVVIDPNDGIDKTEATKAAKALRQRRDQTDHADLTNKEG